MWGPNDIPPQRPEHEGTPVDYKTDGNGAVHEIPAAQTAARDAGNPMVVGRIVLNPPASRAIGPAFGVGDESKRMVPRDAPRPVPLDPSAETNSIPYRDLCDIVNDPEVARALQTPGRIELQRDERARRYMPTLAELIDRMAICQLKAIFIPESRAEYDREIADIVHDVDLILDQKSDSGFVFGAEAIRAAMVIMLTNRYIWENESLARAGSNGQDHLLKLTHSINGVRNTAKNELSKLAGDRIDLKIDCFAAELIERFGNWNIYGSSGAV